MMPFYVLHLLGVHVNHLAFDPVDNLQVLLEDSGNEVEEWRVELAL
jgi:hypothetical protein